MSRETRHTDCDWLYHQYVVREMNPNQIADICGVDVRVIKHWLKKYKIHRRKIPRSHKRRRNKVAALAYKGDRCQIPTCRYDRCKKALEFHHVNPPDKRFTISQGLENHWPTLKKEIDKCLLVCKNCHTEAHSGILKQEDLEEILRQDLERNAENS